MNASLNQRTVLVTGASGGIGRAIAVALDQEGAQLALHYHRHPERLEDLLPRLSAGHVALGADLRKEEDVERLFRDSQAALGRLDHLIVNAGIWIADPVPLHEMSLDQWQTTLDSDLTSAFLCCRSFLRSVATRGPEDASIVLIGSTAAIFGEADHADYSAAKSGLTYGLNRSVKNEIVRVARLGRVNTVCPGWTDTPMAQAHTEDPSAVRRATATMPLRKIATPEDVAAATVFLLSPTLAGHISGAVLPVAGGMEGRLLHLD